VSDLWLPEPDEPRSLICLTCGKGFAEREVEGWQRHVGQCARENPTVKREVFGPHPDPEFERHMVRLRHRMEAEGRKEVRANEM